MDLEICITIIIFFYFLLFMRAKVVFNRNLTIIFKLK